MEEYNWNLVLSVSLPIGIVEAVIFYLNIGDIWKYIVLVIGIALSGVIVYIKDKRKSNVYTASTIVFLIAIIIQLVKKLNLI